jgi:hypothetical protein
MFYTCSAILYFRRVKYLDTVITGLGVLRTEGPAFESCRSIGIFLFISTYRTATLHTYLSIQRVKGTCVLRSNGARNVKLTVHFT